jgi:2-iminobutanoate/2-iminopropanoate deaminase
MTDRAYSLPINDVRKRYLTGPVLPTSTLLVVAGLARPDFLVEISAVAIIDN